MSPTFTGRRSTRRLSLCLLACSLLALSACGTKPPEPEPQPLCLPPQIPSAKATGGIRVIQFNNQLPAVAAEEGATFVDIFSNMNPQTMLMADGLHLNEAGNQKVAELFYAAIKTRYHREPGQ